MNRSLTEVFCELVETDRCALLDNGCECRYLRTLIGCTDRVLLCEPEKSVSGVMSALELEKRNSGAATFRLGQDRRWQVLLRLAFSSRATAVVGSYQIILGLAKLARFTGTPLNIRHVLLTDISEGDWLSKSLAGMMDAKLWHCYTHRNDRAAERRPDSLYAQLNRQLLPWNSILDYCANRTEMGLCVEIVTFPGKPLPKLPSGARIILRPWNAKTDIPFCMEGK